MTFPRPAAFPGGRVLAGWWKQLTAWQPQSLWIGSVALERVEALCSIRQSEPLTPFHGILLASLDAQLPLETASLDRRLGVSQVLLERLLTNLEQKGIVARNSHGWILTEMGAHARQHSTLPGSRVDRRSFWFVADLEDSQSRAFVVPASSSIFQPVEANRIDRSSLEALQTSAKKDLHWKRSRGFPADVEGIIAPESVKPANEIAAWEKIVVVHPYRLQAALITYTRESGESALAAFPFQEHGWALAATPVFDFAASWQEVFPDLPLEPAEEMVAEAWRKWLAQRGQMNLVDAYRLQRRANRIGVALLADAPDVLAVPRGDLARGEAWLLLGDSSLRRAVPMELESLTPPGPTAVPAAQTPG